MQSLNSGSQPKNPHNGQFVPAVGTYEVIHSTEHRKKITEGAKRRALRDYAHISVCGVVYPNLTKASEAVGISTRALKNYALSDNVVYAHVFFLESTEALT